MIMHRIDNEYNIIQYNTIQCNIFEIIYHCPQNDYISNSQRLKGVSVRVSEMEILLLLNGGVSVSVSRE